nr:hypothetical protein GCM10025732_25720 [Glycomyces mayteni]
MLPVRLGDPRALVGHGERHRVRARLHLDPHDSPLRSVLDGVPDEVRHRAAHARAVHRGLRAPRPGHLHRRGRELRGHLPREDRQVHRPPVDHAGPAARVHQQLAHHVAQPLGRVPAALQALPVQVQVRLRVRQDHVGAGDEDRERGPQLVARLLDQPALHQGRALQPLQHRVERGRERPRLGRPLRAPHPQAQVRRPDPLGRGPHPLERAHRPARPPPRERHRDRQQERRGEHAPQARVDPGARDGALDPVGAGLGVLLLRDRGDREDQDHREVDRERPGERQADPQRVHCASRR